jgi:hypothetical protein
MGASLHPRAISELVIFGRFFNLHFFGANFKIPQVFGQIMLHDLQIVAQLLLQFIEY